MDFRDAPLPTAVAVYTNTGRGATTRKAAIERLLHLVLDSERGHTVLVYTETVDSAYIEIIRPLIELYFEWLPATDGINFDYGTHRATESIRFSLFDREFLLIAETDRRTLRSLMQVREAPIIAVDYTAALDPELLARLEHYAEESMGQVVPVGFKVFDMRSMNTQEEHHFLFEMYQLRGLNDDSDHLANLSRPGSKKAGTSAYHSVPATGDCGNPHLAAGLFALANPREPRIDPEGPP